MSYGLDEFCKQMLTRDAPIRLTENQPVIGRFYPKGCRQKQLDNGDLYAEFDGVGYAWSLPTRKMSFFAGAVVTYNQDYKCTPDNDLYAYFPTRTPLAAPQFKITSIEQPLTSLINASLPQLSDQFGQGLLQTKLAEGFTVIRDHDSQMDFGLGQLPLGSKPEHPFQIQPKNAYVYENLATEVHRGEHDFIGPIVVANSGKAINILVKVDSARAVGILLMAAWEADPLLNAFIQYGPANEIRPTRGEPWTGIASGGGAEYRRTVAVPRGAYYVVIDHNATLDPPQNILDDTPALVRYMISIGDEP